MWPAACLSISVTVVFLVGILWPPKGGELGVYLPESTSRGDSVVAAVSSGASLVAAPYDNVLIVVVDSADTRAQLRASGAWLFNPLKLSGCNGQAASQAILAAQGRIAADTSIRSGR